VRSPTSRLYLATVALLLFLVLWAVVAAHPWGSAAATKAEPDPRLVALDRRQRRLAHEAALVRSEVSLRWRDYRRALRRREAEIAAVRAAHVRRLAAARAAEARLAALRDAAGSTGAVSAVQSAPAAAGPAPAAPPARVVTLPPQVRVVTLPAAAAPATSSTSSRP
jgi:hypothetical protein